MSQSEVITCSRRNARENACVQVAIGFGFARKWSDFAGQSNINTINFRCSNENRSNGSLFDSEMIQMGFLTKSGFFILSVVDGVLQTFQSFHYCSGRVFVG